MSFCRNCGIKLDDDTVFCKACGTPVKRDNTSQIINNISTNVNSEELRQPDKHKKHKGIIIATIVLSSALLLILLFFVVSHFSGNSTKTPDKVPDWYVVNAVAVKDNELCFSRNDGFIFVDTGYTFVYHYVFNKNGTLKSMKQYIFFDDEATARYYTELETSCLNDDDPTNDGGLIKGDVRYYNIGNISVEEYLPQYTKNNVGTLDSTISMYRGYGWEIVYL